jgi:hypothetical protein
MQAYRVLARTAGRGAALLFVLSSQTALAQPAESTSSFRTIGGAITVTNNGISLLPTFTLGKPAAVFDMSVGSQKLSFDPQFRFALEGRPWSFIFWWRCRPLRTGRFFLNAGAHPAIVFKTIPLSTGADSTETIIAHRYLAAEVAPGYVLSDGISLGLYYLYSHGFDRDATSNTHFLTINANFSSLSLTEHLYLKFAPQVYYLRMDARVGYYATATVSLLWRNFPLSVQSIINQAIETDIIANGNFVWNVSLIYAFRREYGSRS